MKKPVKKAVNHYDYHEIIHYIEEKYNVSTHDYYNKFRKNRPPHEEIPYANFWHWFIHANGNIHNGGYGSIPDDLPWGEIKDDPKCYDKDWMTTPKFVMEIVDLIVKEFGKEILGEKLWVEW